MIFEYDCTIPAGTPKESPYKKVLKLTWGIIHKLEIISSYACAGLVYCSIWQGEHQVWPTNPDYAFRLTGNPISGKEFFELIEPPWELEFRGWSPSAEKPHTVIVRFWILRPHQLIPFSEYMWQARGL